MTDDLYARLRAAYSVADDLVPKGYLSMRQWSAKMRLSLPQTTRIVNRGVEAGLLSKLDLKVGGRRVPHYAEAKKKR